MSQKNQVIYSKDPSTLERLNVEYSEYIGRDTKLNLREGTLTVYALPFDYKKKRQAAAKARRKEQDNYNPEWEKYDR